MKEKLTPFETVLLQEGTPRLLVEYVKQYKTQLSLEFRLLAPVSLKNAPEDAETKKVLAQMEEQKKLILSDIANQDIPDRTKRACLRKGIKTVQDVCSKTFYDIRGIVGKNAAKELEYFLEVFHLSFKDWEQHCIDYGWDELLNKKRPVKKISMNRLGWRVPKNVSIVCWKAEIKTLGELSSKTETELLKIKGCGQQTVHEIKDLLRIFGLSLKAE